MFTTHFYDDGIDDVAVSYLVLKIIIQLGFGVGENRIKRIVPLFPLKQFS